MQKEIKTVDIAELPDLLNLAEEVRSTRSSRLLKRGGESVAILSPVEPTTVGSSPKLRELAHRLAGSLADINIPGWESSEAAEHWVEEART